MQNGVHHLIEKSNSPVNSQMRWELINIKQPNPFQLCERGTKNWFWTTKTQTPQKNSLKQYPPIMKTSLAVIEQIIAH